MFVGCWYVCVREREMERECERERVRARARAREYTVLRTRVSPCAKGKRAHFGAAIEDPASIESGTTGERDG